MQKGFKDLGVILYNRALGGTDSMQNLYELIRVKDSREISECDLIVCESNVNERGQNNPHMLYRQVNWFYRELFRLNKRVLILLLPHLILKKKDLLITFIKDYPLSMDLTLLICKLIMKNTICWNLQIL